MASERHCSWSEQAEFEENSQDKDSDQGYPEDESDYYDNDDDDNDDSRYPHSNLWGDFSVRAKVSRSTPRLTTKRAASAACLHKHRNSPPKQDRHLPPEILHLIISQVDHSTLCRVSRVSHQFNAIAKRYFERIGAWKLNELEEGDLLLEKLRSGSVNVLRIDCPTNWSRLRGREGRDEVVNTWIGAWNRFVEHIAEPIYSCTMPLLEAKALSLSHVVDATKTLSLSERDPKSHCLLDGVKKVVIGDTALPALLPYLHRIRSLEICDQDWMIYRDFYLQPVLKACPSLDTLIIHGYSYSKLWIAWSAENNDTTPETEAWTHSQLIHLSVKSVSISQDSMASILTSCPRLIYFRAWSVNFRKPGCDSTNLSYDYRCSPSLPLEQVYRQVACLRPNIPYFSAVARCPNRDDLRLGHLALTAELFPHVKHLDLGKLQISSDIDDCGYICCSSLSLVTSKFLSRLTSIEFCDVPSQAVDAILKYCRMLTHLKVRYEKGSRYRRPPPPLSSQDPPSWSSSWRCPKLRVMELKILWGTVEEEGAIFKFLVHACPNLEELTLRMSLLRVGQEDFSVVTTTESRTVTKPFVRHPKWPSTNTKIVWEPVKTEVWYTHENVFSLLGRLTRLKRLDVHIECRIPGVLYPSNFAFLEAKRHDRNRDGGDMAKPLFCPLLQSLRIYTDSQISFGRARGESLTERQFIQSLKMIRPEVAISFEWASKR